VSEPSLTKDARPAVPAPSSPDQGARTASADQNDNDCIPSGADDRLKNVTVPAGWTRWVTYHLEMAGTRDARAQHDLEQLQYRQPGMVRHRVDVGRRLGTCGAGGVGYLKK
jgi:hypothetical protein